MNEFLGKLQRRSVTFFFIAFLAVIIIAVVTLGTTVITAPLSKPLKLEVDLSERALLVYHGNTLSHRYDIAVGEAEHPTPTGSFAITRVIWDPWWIPPDSDWADDANAAAPADPDNPMEGAKLFFKYPAYYIHGTNQPHTLGSAASHGCVRMRPSDVEALAELVQRHGGAARSDAWFEKVKERDQPSTEIRLGDPVPLTIHS